MTFFSALFLSVFWKEGVIGLFHLQWGMVCVVASLSVPHVALGRQFGTEGKGGIEACGKEIDNPGCLFSRGWGVWLSPSEGATNTAEARSQVINSSHNLTHSRPKKDTGQ